MTTQPIISTAARVYDQDTHSEADLTFLAAMAKADRDYLDALNAANISFGGGSEAWLAVKRLASRSREKARADALAAFEADDTEFEFLIAAE